MTPEQPIVDRTLLYIILTPLLGTLFNMSTHKFEIDFYSTFLLQPSDIENSWPNLLKQSAADQKFVIHSWYQKSIRKTTKFLLLCCHWIWLYLINSSDCFSCNSETMIKAELCNFDYIFLTNNYSQQSGAICSNSFMMIATKQSAVQSGKGWSTILILIFIGYLSYPTVWFFFF